MIWNRIRRDLDRGITNIISVGRYLAERTRIETSLAKVVFDSHRIQKKIDDKTLELGERIFELRDEKRVLQNAVVRDLISQIEDLKRELDLYLSQSEEMGGRRPEEVRDDEASPADEDKQ